MSKNIKQVYDANPITSNAGTDLMYFGQSPYGVGDDAGMLFSDFSAQFSTSLLPNTKIFVGNASNIATAVNLGGDASISNTGVLTIANNAVTFAKMQFITSNRLLGNLGGGVDIGEVQIAGGLALTGSGYGTLTTSPFTGDVTTPPESFVTTIADSVITNNKIANSTIDLTTKVTGILPQANGGTGANASAYGGTRLIFQNSANTAFQTVSNMSYLTATNTLSLTNNSTVGLGLSISSTTSGVLGASAAIVLARQDTTNCGAFTILSSGGVSRWTYGLFSSASGVGGSIDLIFRYNGTPTNVLTLNTSGNVVVTNKLLVNTTNTPSQINIEGPGSATDGGTLAYFGASSPVTVTNLHGILINKSGTDALLIGINKNSTTGSTPSNACYISSYLNNSTISIGRGSSNSLPDKSDILIGSNGDVTIGNGSLFINTVQKGLYIKSAAVSAGTANAFLITGVTLVAGTVTINNNVIDASSTAVFTVTANGGTPGTGYRVSIGVGTVTVTSTSALDTSVGNISITRGF